MRFELPRGGFWRGERYGLQGRCGSFHAPCKLRNVDGTEGEHSFGVGVPAPERFEMRKSGSWLLALNRRGAESRFGRCESLHNCHGAATLRAYPEWSRRGGGGPDDRLLFLRLSQEGKA